MSFLYRINDPGFDRFSRSFCQSQPCHYLKLSSVAEHGEMLAHEAIPWLTSPHTALAADVAATESRTLFYNRYRSLDGEVGLPFSNADMDELTESHHFPARFFLNEVRFRRIAIHHMTPVGPCWFLRERHFSAVTLWKTEQRLCQTIVIIREPTAVNILQLILEKCKSLESIWEQPLLLIVVLLDFALEEHRQWSNSLLLACDRLYHTLALAPNHTALSRPRHFIRTRDEELAELLTDLTSRRHETIPSVGNLRSLIASIEVMADVARLYKWDWTNTFEYFTISAKDILEKFVEADARFEAYIKTVEIRVAQRDTQINQRLARSSAETAIASKRDSSSMKIIAMLTTLFLPSALVAAILSTPEYSNWPAGTTWRFWAISLPLTTIIMLGLLIWLLFDHKHTLRAKSKIGDADITLKSIKNVP